ncbi:MAG: amidase [Alphaproteobacteria bacterium]|nr:MAG: amidase [Caulobacteraceae bacterium]TPW05869.1 MAG: amidase [Alphaproteobacteria bacterium]
MRLSPSIWAGEDEEMSMDISRRRLMEGAAAVGMTAALAACAPEKPAPRGDVLGNLDAVGVAEKIRNKEFTPLEAVESAIARAEKIQPQLNFMVTDMFAHAREAAAKPQTGMFAGVPTLIKDLNDVTGFPTKFGSRAFAGAPPATAQTPYTNSIMASGVVPIGKSTTPEFGFTATTEPLLTGATLNPWNTKHSSGGSSGGSAAAVAAGVVPIAHASDGGGSIRIPASCCGLVGLKPSRGRHITDERDQGPVPISVNGCVSHSVRDTVAWLYSTQRTGDDKVFEPVGMIAGASARKLRIGVQIKTFLGKDPDTEVAGEIAKVAATLKQLGHDVREFKAPIDGAAFSDAFTLYWAGMALDIREQVKAKAPGVALEELLEPLSLGLADLAEKAGPAGMARAVATLQRTQRKYEGMFPGIDVLLTPVLAKPPALIGEYAPTLPFEKFLTIQDYVAYTPLINAVGAPAISLPLGMSSTGLPLGAHFAAKGGDEQTLIELAYQLEQALPWSGRKPGVHA